MVQLRSSAKRNASKQVTDDDKEFPEASSSEDDVHPPAKKRRRVGAAVKKRQTRKYRGLSQLCIDELYIIFAYVYPMDLLNLARTCKYLRSILMHKSSQFLWKAALGRVEGLPHCPADLTEPQYTNLVFYARCHRCDKPAKSILWNLRRRYCPACKAQRLRYLHYCDYIIWSDPVVPCDRVMMGKSGLGLYVDQDQLDSFMHEYGLLSDKNPFLEEKRKERKIISEHAYECAEWQRGHGRVKRFDLEILRKERQTSILERLEQHGYGPELAYFEQTTIQNSYKSAFKPHTHLTDTEWEKMWPKWVEIMGDYRFQRLDATCYYSRRRLLVSEYDKYVIRGQTPDTPTFDLLPHVADLASFPPFQHIIEAPEETQMDSEPFASAFAQLPIFLGDWKKDLDFVAELVKLPPHLTLQDTSHHLMESSSTPSGELCSKDSAKLHLACALFRSSGRDLFTYPDVLSASMRYKFYPCSRTFAGNQTGAGTTQERFSISFLEEAPYIVHACGLDPNTATADDMDRRNARLRCLACKNSRVIIMDWRDAVLHASDFHGPTSRILVPLSESPRWQVISDDHIDAIRAIEESTEKRSRDYWQRCLLCRPRVGDAIRETFGTHMQDCHGLDMKDLKEGVHHKRLGLEGCFSSNKVEMVEEGGQVIFRQPRCY